MGKVAATRDPSSAHIGFHMWNLDAANEAQKWIDEILKEGLKLATEQYEVFAYFIGEWGSELPDDPMTIRIELPIGVDEDQCPSWTLSLTDLVDLFVGGLLVGAPGDLRIDPAAAPHAIAIRDGLRSLADKIDRALPAPAGRK